MSQPSINKTFLIVLLGILAALGPFSIDMYLPGFQQIARDFGTNEKAVAFTLTSYFIGIAAGQLIYGPIVDKYGRKKPLIFGLLVYSIAALGCSLSPDIESMTLMRLLQALGGCVGMVASNAIISDVFESHQRAKAFSSLMLVMGVAPLIAPSIGSFLVEQLDWRYIFYFLTFFSALVIALIFFFLPETSRYMHSNPLKPEKIAKEYLEILKNKTFLSYTLAGSVSMSVLYAYISSASFIFLTLYGLDKSTFSIVFAVNAAGFISGSYLNGVMTRFAHYIKIARVVSVLLCIVTFLAMMMIYFNDQIQYKWMVVASFAILFLTGFINPNTTAASLTPFTGNVGAASALGGFSRMGLGAAVAAAIGIFQGETAITLFATTFALAVLTLLLLAFAPKPDRKTQL